MTLKRILLIAPDHPDLNWPVELEQVGSKHQVVPLLGRVDQERVTRATTGQRFDVIHVASHSGDDGVQLSDGWLSKEQFGQMARHVRCAVVFFNSCNSARLGQYMIDMGIMTVIDWTIPVVDGDAIRTAAYFYDELAVEGDLRRAYDKVNPRDGSLSFLAGQGYIEDLIRPVVQQMSELGKQTNALGESIVNLGGMVATQGRALRWVAAAVIAAIVLALVLVVVGIVRAQDGTIPPVGPVDAPTPTEGSGPGGTPSPTDTLLPGCGPSGGQPKKCQTPTDTPVWEPLPPTDTLEPPTATFVPTEPPTVEPSPSAAPTGYPPQPTEIPTEAPGVTFTPLPVVDSPTATETATALDTATPRPTLTRDSDPDPTDTPASTWTPTADENRETERQGDPETATPLPTRFVLPTVTPSSTSSLTATPRPTATKEYVPCWN